MSKKIEKYLTYDDVLIRPGHSEVLPGDTNLNTQFSKNIALNIPIVSAAMDTVTESSTAIVMAQEGGIGVVHKNLSPTDQAAEVLKVTKYEAGMILDPITISPDLTLGEFLEQTKKHKSNQKLDKRSQVAIRWLHQENAANDEYFSQYVEGLEFGV